MPGVTFHGGEPFTADDVAFTWARLNTPGANRGPLAAVTTMRAVDATTVDIETAQPFPILLNALLGMGIMSRSWSEAHGAAAASDLSSSTENFATRHENGTGPFVVESRQVDGATVLKPFKGWWDKPVSQSGPGDVPADQERGDPDGELVERKHGCDRGLAITGRRSGVA